MLDVMGNIHRHKWLRKIVPKRVSYCPAISPRADIENSSFAAPPAIIDFMILSDCLVC